MPFLSPNQHRQSAEGYTWGIQWYNCIQDYSATQLVYFCTEWFPDMESLLFHVSCPYAVSDFLHQVTDIRTLSIKFADHHGSCMSRLVPSRLQHDAVYLGVLIFLSNRNLQCTLFTCRVILMVLVLRAFLYLLYISFFIITLCSAKHCPSVLWHYWLGVKKSVQPGKIEWWGVGVVICLERAADCLHIVQLMPLYPKTPSFFASFKSRPPFWYQLTLVVVEKGR